MREIDSLTPIQEIESNRRSGNPLTKTKGKRDLQLDAVKGLSMLTIIIRHLDIIPAWSAIWAAPAFVLVTASLYCGRLHQIKFTSIWENLVWISGMVIFFSLFLGWLVGTPFPELTLISSLKQLFLRNPILGRLWYFLLYFQLVAALYLLSKINFSIYSGIIWGILAFTVSQVFSYLLLAKTGKGLTINLVSWSFVIWLGLYRYHAIKAFFERQTPFQLIGIIIAGVLLIGMVVLVGGKWYNTFLQQRTTDFIFPTYIIQLGHLFVIFGLVQFIIRYLPNSVGWFLGFCGKHSLNLYMFHIFFLKYVFPEEWGLFRVISVVLCSLLVGHTLTYVRKALFTYAPWRYKCSIIF